MSILAAAGTLLPGLFSLIDNLHTSDEERAEMKRKLVEMDQRGELAQLKVNAVEATHSSVFVAGWRPFIGWVCGLALAWTYLVFPFVHFLTLAFGLNIPVHAMPVLDLGTMMPVLLGMLGLGAMRSWEKKAGVSREELIPRPIDRTAGAVGSLY